MTMPKFEPVAEVLWYDPALRHTPEPAGKIIDGSMSFIESAAIGTQLYTADQLTEAYEAGKREASEDIEQAAFEKWLYDKCPSGDVESVQRQWLKSYEYAEFAEKLEQAAQIEMMQEAQIDAERYRWLRNALSDRSGNGVSHHFCSIRTSEELDIEIDKASKKKPCELIVFQPDQALEQFAAKVREQCAQMLLNGSFLHDQSPARLLAIEAAKAIRAIKELP